jgi:PAS domain-containing protein
MGRVVKIVMIATDITAAKQQAADYSGQIAAIGKAQAVIEFGMDGKVLTANENFLATLGYSLSEIQGQHHSLFVDAAERAGPPTASSGNAWAAASTTPGATSASARAGARSGSRPRTTPSSTSMASPSRW